MTYPLIDSIERNRTRGVNQECEPDYAMTLFMMFRSTQIRCMPSRSNKCRSAVRLSVLGALLSAPLPLWASEVDVPSGSWRPASTSIYLGAGNEYKFRDALAFRYESAQETMVSLTFDWHLADRNPFSRAAAWLGATLEPAVLLGYRDDRQQDLDIYELALYANLRWSDFPWNDRLPTTIAVGWGASYTSDITANEAEDAVEAPPDEGPQRWLNYLVVEYGFSLPHDPRWQFFYRLHHRSGASGLFASHEVGSNVMGLGVRYSF